MSRRLRLAERGSVTLAASPRSQSRLNLNRSWRDGSAIGARNARSASMSTLHAVAEEALPAQFLLGGRQVRAIVDHPHQAPDERGHAAGQPVHRAEVQDAQPPVGQHAEVARMRVGVQHPGPGRAGEQEPDEQQPHPVPLFLGAVADDLRQRGPVHPLRDQHVAGGRTTTPGTAMSGSPA